MPAINGAFMRRSLLTIPFAFATLTAVPAALAHPAPAQAPAPAPPPAIEVEVEAGDGKKPKKPKLSAAEKRAIASTPAGIFGLKGRVVTQLRLRQADRVVVDAEGVPQSDEVESLDLALDSARFSLLYQAPMPWLQAEIEVEVSDPDQVELKDVYALAEGGGFHVKAGNFKPPTSSIDRESVWTLPMTSRGFVNDLLDGWLAVGGRRPGVQLGYEGTSGIEPELTLGAFQGDVLIEQVGDDRDLELIDEAGMDAQTWVARAQIELAKIDVGVFFAQRVGSPAPLQTEHYSLVGADVVLDREIGSFGVRGWLDGHVGESWYAHDERPQADGDPWFLAARAIVAGRYGGLKDDQPFIELYTSLGMLDPDLDVSSDWAWDFAAGVNGGLWDRARITLEASLTNTSRNFPASYFGGPYSKTLGLTLQAGVAF